MHHLKAFSSQITPLSIQILSSQNNYTTNRLYFSTFWPRNYIKKWLILAMDGEQNKFEVDQQKARQALNDLDLQLDNFSKKQIKSPKIKASTLGDFKARMKEDPPEITGSVLGFFAFGLFIFTIFYNVLFLTVIKPAVDGPDDVIVANVTTTSDASIETQP